MTTIELKKKLSNPDRFKIKTDYNFLMGFPRILILLVSLLIINNAHAIVYVDKDRNGNGTSWANAYNSIEAAIAATGENQEFWVAEGTYTPSSDAFWGTQLIPKQGSQFYGGFTGNETSRDQRDVRGSARDDAIIGAIELHGQRLPRRQREGQVAVRIGAQRHL